MFRNKKTEGAKPISAPKQLSAGRLFYGVVGGALAFYGWQQKRGNVGLVASSVGLSLVAKSLRTSLFSAPADVLAALMTQLRTTFPKLLPSSGTEA